MKKLLVVGIISGVCAVAYFSFTREGTVDRAKMLPPIHVLNTSSNVVDELSFSPDAKILASVGQGHLKLWNTSNWSHIKFPNSSDLTRSEIDVFGSIDKWINFSPDSKQIAISHIENTTEIIDIRKVGPLNRIHQIKIKGPNEDNLWTEKLSYSPDGKYFVQNDNCNLRIWETKGWKLLHTLNFKNPTIECSHHAFSISPNSKIIATAPSKYNVRLWDIATGLPLDESKQPVGIPLLRRDNYYDLGTVQFSPDGTKLAVITGATVYLWDMQQQKIIYTTSDSTSSVEALSFSPNGKYFVTVGDAVIIWDTLSGNKLKTLTQSHKGYADAIYSPDGKFLVAGGRDGRIRIWNTFSLSH